METKRPIPELTEARKALALSLEDFGQRVGVSAASASRWETGDRKIDPPLVRKVAELTGLAPHALRPDIFPAPEMEAAE